MIGSNLNGINGILVSGTFSGVRVAFLPTDRDLGVFLEIFDGLPDDEREPAAT